MPENLLFSAPSTIGCTSGLICTAARGQSCIRGGGAAVANGFRSHRVHLVAEKDEVKPNNGG